MSFSRCLMNIDNPQSGFYPHFILSDWIFPSVSSLLTVSTCVVYVAVVEGAGEKKMFCYFVVIYLFFVVSLGQKKVIFSLKKERKSSLFYFEMNVIYWAVPHAARGRSFQGLTCRGRANEWWREVGGVKKKKSPPIGSRRIALAFFTGLKRKGRGELQ